MEIIKMAKAGSILSNDCLVTVHPSDERTITIDSIVLKQFGKAIEETVLATLEAFHIEKGNIQIQDKGALDYTIRARLETAIRRGTEELQ